ncbi:transporter substrate-binding domain-containing protein [Sneathiella sp. P13V-1]|uniref:substrate-binding periplasmic protein n=1 Tax=Sneathiella sp. P13V-1 TaxID=2697366 RepID=UPI00187B4BE6|nr:transporter substrate-binding domain-containing protein [Sneathiella sp. P13V-1]MBE7637388.1 transporter substrate-binding domain-containing protein [Sneathiella sp. P13V-1]
MSANAYADCLNLAADSSFENYPSLASQLEKQLSKNGICAKILYIPGKRGTKMLLSHDIDGEVGRISYYKRRVGSSAIKVPTPLFTTNGMFVSRVPDLKKYQDYKGKIGILRGWVWMDEAVKNFVPRNIVAVDNIDTLHSIFRKKRVDAILLPEGMVNAFKLEKEKTILLASKLTYHVWLSSKNRNLVAPFDKAIREFLEDGGQFLPASTG